MLTADRLLSLTALIDADRRRVLVVDDDPTGAQAAADVDVVLGTDLSATWKWFDEGARSLYVVANTERCPRPMRPRHCAVTATESSPMRRTGETVWPSYFEGIPPCGGMFSQKPMSSALVTRLCYSYPHSPRAAELPSTALISSSIPTIDRSR